jgi:hypothetical protein
MKRKQKLQRRKKINRKAAATPQSLTGNFRNFLCTERENCLADPRPQILSRAGRSFCFFFSIFQCTFRPYHRLISATMAPKAKTVKPQENVQLGPQTREGELVFGVARIFASFNDTFVHVTDLS